MFHDPIRIELAALAALAGTLAYVLFGGADFGGGVWDLLATGSRKEAQRQAIHRAMGPVWEANHVWLIFVVVVLFTCFPRGFAALSIALFLPFHLALVGIMLRGASFVFHKYEAELPRAGADFRAWGVIFGVASLITPLLLGAAFGTFTEGAIRIDGTQVSLTTPRPWLTPYCLANGLLALLTCAYLAAVYLTNETTGALRDDFRRRALASGTATAIAAAVVLVMARSEAPWFYARLLSLRTLPVLAAGAICFAGSAWAVVTRRYRASRIFAASEIALVLIGWALAHDPYLIYPDLKIADSTAPLATVRFLVLTLPLGAAIIAPSLWLLFSVFKTQRAR